MQWYTTLYILFFAICLSILLIEYRFVNEKIISSYPTANNNNRTSYIIKEEAHNNIITSSSSTNDINFWDNIDLNNNNTTKLNCGRYKCLFRAKMNEDVGYLIFSNHHTPGTGIQFETEAETSYQVAEYMKSNFDIKHLYIDKPKQIKMISLPNSYNSTLKGRRRHKSQKKKNMFYANQHAIVQKIQIAKDPWIIISLPEGYRKLKYFYREKVSIRRSAFTNTLRKDTIAAMKALSSIPLLSNDYQIILDGNGNLYQFDIDRVFLGGIYKSHHHFNNAFIKIYDQCMKMLCEILTWSSSSHHGRSDGNTSTYIDERKQYKSGEEILSEYHLNKNASSLSSCIANEVVGNMSGRIVEQKEVTTKTAMQMMIDLVDMILPNNEPQHEIDNNCSRLPI